MIDNQKRGLVALCHENEAKLPEKSAMEPAIDANMSSAWMAREHQQQQEEK